MKLRKPSILVINWVSSCLSFLLSASTAATYIFTARNCTTSIISLEPRALTAESQQFTLSCSISYWDLIKCLYFADTTERGDREGERRPKDMVTLRITLISLQFIFKGHFKEGFLENYSIFTFFYTIFLMICPFCKTAKLEKSFSLWWARLSVNSFCFPFNLFYDVATMAIIYKSN